MGIKISQVPNEHKEKVVKNMMQQRSLLDVLRCVEEDTPLSMAFGWRDSPEGQRFWDDIDEQVSTKKSSSSSATKNDLDVYTEEAERRGFAVGVVTKYGEIVKGFPNELLPDGDFFYSNIKVFKQGKWIKPLHKVTETKVSDEMPEMAAIHALFSDLISTIRRN